MIRFVIALSASVWVGSGASAATATYNFEATVTKNTISCGLGAFQQQSPTDTVCILNDGTPYPSYPFPTSPFAPLVLGATYSGSLWIDYTDPNTGYGHLTDGYCEIGGISCGPFSPISSILPGRNPDMNSDVVITDGKGEGVFDFENGGGTFYHLNDYSQPYMLNADLQNVRLTLNTVPLPAAGWMLLVGLGGLAAASKRRRRLSDAGASR